MSEDTKSKLSELFEHIRKEVDSKAKPGETWNVGSSPKIWVSLVSVQTSGCMDVQQIDDSNCHDLEGVMELARSRVKKCEDDAEHYAKTLLEKCGPES